MDTGSRMASLRRVRQRADKQFVRVDRAYRVLADPVKKLVGHSRVPGVADVQQLKHTRHESFIGSVAKLKRFELQSRVVCCLRLRFTMCARAPPKSVELGKLHGMKSPGGHIPSGRWEF